MRKTNRALSFLHSCRRRWPSEDPEWIEGFVYEFDAGEAFCRGAYGCRSLDKKDHAARSLILHEMSARAESGSHSILYDPNIPERETVEDGYSFAAAGEVR